MPEICLYAQVHQPYRLRRFRVFDVGIGAPWFDDDLNRRIIQRVARTCYLPANRLLTDLIRRSHGEFRLALSITGTTIELMADWAPEALESFQELVATGGVELLGETWYHSLADLADRDEYCAQVRQHARAMQRWFGVEPRVFRNTELICSDQLASEIPALRFGGGDWEGWPLTADRYAEWVAGSPDETVNLYLDYETFGEHHRQETGVLEFLQHLPGECRRRGIGFTQPGRLAAGPARTRLSFACPTSGADEDRVSSAWPGNRIQQAAHERLYALRSLVLASGDTGVIEGWRRLTSRDHLHYMCATHGSPTATCIGPSAPGRAHTTRSWHT